MKKFFPLLLLFVSNIFYAQTIEILQKGDTIQKPKYHQFTYLCDSTDISQAIFIARIKSSGSLKNTTHLFYVIKDNAQSMGANAYRFENFTKTDAENGELILSAFFIDDSIYNANYKYIPKDKIFIFGNDNLTETKTQGYKVQGVKQEISSGKYKIFPIGENDEIKINKGGFAGMSGWFRRTEYGHSKYLTFSGFGLNGGGATVGSGGVNGVGVSFNTGAINHVEANLGLALLRIYEEQK